MDTEVAWAAGFFEGEGSIGWYKDSNAGPTLRPQLTVVQCGLEGHIFLYRFIAAVGVGHIGGPYERFGSGMGTKPRYHVKLTSDKVVTAMEVLLPYLTKGNPKTKKYLAGVMQWTNRSDGRSRPRSRQHV